MSKNVWLKKFLFSIVRRKMQKQWDKASRDCRKAQQKVLQDILAYAADTVYGREHNFASIRTFADYQKNVPVNNYDNLAPYVNRHKQGEENVLFPGKPLMYAATSGTTRAPKWVPVTRKYYDEVYAGMSKLWLASCLHQNPTIFDGHDLSLVGKEVEGYNDDGVPYGSMSGHVYNSIPGFMKDIHVVPYVVYTIDDYMAKYYALIRIASGADITYCISANPSTYIKIVQVMEENAEKIIKDVAEGTIAPDVNIAPEKRSQIEAVLKPDPERASRLRAILEKHGRLIPKYVWPNLALANVWKCGNAGLYLDQVVNDYPAQTVFREFAYQASEVRGGLVLDNDDIGTVMACHLIYFEFIKEEDINEKEPRIYQAWELEKGRRYYIIVTTPSGFYRYNMHDILEVTGFYNQFPKMKYIQKGAGIVNLTGEKLTETQLIDAVKEVEEETKTDTRFFVCCGNVQDSCYHLFVEFAEDNADAEGFRSKVEQKLISFNPEYESKRGSERINPLRIHRLQDNAFEKFKSKQVARGAREGQFKIMHLMKNDDRFRDFLQLEKK
ncbi:MAG TPA: GH3 auxin-responsive promoter family protein [Spirochaetota bacterium]|nr:GH3 auxin-responsive promoter family protein [Spirochaetota bacterium]